MSRIQIFWSFLMIAAFAAVGCTHNVSVPSDHTTVASSLKIDPATGIPYAFVFQFPIDGFDTSDFGFGFGSINSNFCLASGPSGCTEYGAHTGRDTVVSETPVGTEVLAPADGIVRVTTNRLFGGYGSDSRHNAHYLGCVIVLEHEFASGQAVLSILGHVLCESSVPYDPAARRGNPTVGTIVRRGQYVAHIAHYWHGAGQSIDWHHLHWGMRKGRFAQTSLADVVKGYVPRSEFTTDPVTHALRHPSFLDPFVVVAANGDPAFQSANNVRHHPPGTLLENSSGMYWLVTDVRTIAYVPTSVMAADRYDMTQAVKASKGEFACYAKGPDVASLGPVTLYQRPGSSTVVMAYSDVAERYDVIRWEALLSWGFGSEDLISNQSKISLLEQTYTNMGMRRLRPGTLVKTNDTSEVSIVTPQGTRVPIASGAIFEELGYRWEHVVSLPQSVIDVVAGPRKLPVIDQAFIQSCAVSPPCPGGGSCGGGGVPDVDAGVSPDAGASNGGNVDAGSSGVEICNGKDDNGNGQIDEIFQCKLGETGGPSCISSCNTPGERVCDGPMCSWGSCKPFAESCTNGIDDDCNGKTDCDDPACTSDPACTHSSSGGASGSGGTSSNGKGSNSGGSTGSGGHYPVGSVQIHLHYSGPVIPGLTVLQAWWQPMNGAPRTWGTVTECVDTQPGDGMLDCIFHVPHGTTSFVFQIDLPNGRFWGDESCTTGGCGSTVGTVSLKADGSDLSVDMVPNNTKGQPYYNARVNSFP